MLRDFENITALNKVCKEIFNNNIIFIGHKVKKDYIIDLINNYKTDDECYLLKQIDNYLELPGHFNENLNGQRLYVSLFSSSSERLVKEIKNIANEKEFCENYKYIIHIGRFLSEEYKILSISKLNFNNKEIELESILKFNMMTNSYEYV